MAEEGDNECQQLVKRPKISSIDMKSTEEECYRKDCFDRYGDDLCGLVLSYLSLEDCFRFECLSKQWKRSVFAKRHTLVVDNKLLKKWGIIDNSKIRDINMKALLSVTNKCANIRSIQMTITSKATEVVFIVLMSLMSHSLNAIDVRFSDEIDVSIVDTILGEYGSLFTSISLPQSAINVFKSHNKSYTRLRCLSKTSLAEFPLSILFNETNELIVKSLTQFKCNYMEEDLPLFTTFVDHYRHRLKSYDVVCEEPTEQLNDLSKLQALRRLTLYAIYSEISIACVKQIGVQCKHLQRLTVLIVDPSAMDVSVLYEAMAYFKGLRSLVICIQTEINYSESCDHLSLKPLSHLKRLTHLTLYFNGFPVNATFLDSIDTYLPHIQALSLYIAPEISAPIIESLNRSTKFNVKLNLTRCKNTVLLRRKDRKH